MTKPEVIHEGPTMTATEALTLHRRGQHGDWHEQSALAQNLKANIGAHGQELKPHQLEALEMICVKLSRICCGDPNYEDHWDDIAGYALLGKKGHE